MMAADGGWTAAGEMQVFQTAAKPAVENNQTTLQWLKISDSVSSMRSIAAPVAKHVVQEEDRDQAKAVHRSRRPLERDQGRGGAVKDAAPRVLRRRLCTIYRLPLHLNRDHCCLTSLDIANNIMQASTLPGLRLGSFAAVSGNSELYYLGVSWGFTAIAIALGSSYFQRLCNSVPSLQWVARRHADFAHYATPSDSSAGDDDDLDVGYVNRPEYQSREMNMKSILFTCVLLASKNIDRVNHHGILQYMLTKICGVAVTSEHVYDLENKCLDGLNWQLGPYYRHDHLEETWVDWEAIKA